MATNPFFSGRIPQDLYKKVEDFIKQSGKTKTEVLIESLASYLKHPIETKQPTGNEEVWKEINALKEKIVILEENLSNVIDKNRKLNLDETAENEDKLTSPEKDVTTVDIHSSRSLKTGTISDNIDISNDNIDNRQLSLLEENSESNNQKTKDLKGKILKTNKVPELPDLEDSDAEEIKTKLRNAKAQNKTPVKIGCYLLDISGKEPGNKGALLWKIIEIS